ncbi:hypothetical protein [uncultured Haemophilus sp.]|jgi:hypothetical protein|uniref:hypothetical protein n=1 Tax=uncultured Haemophilus sp. TaxID=237779 RepID=UPI002583C56C|nr:hypothetical protein [uncultured Haemophilus sp.]
MAEIDCYLTEAESLEFIDKMNYVLNLLEQGEIEENEAYQIITAEGEPPPKATTEEEKAECLIEFWET